LRAGVCARGDVLIFTFVHCIQAEQSCPKYILSIFLQTSAQKKIAILYVVVMSLFYL
jgi:hypothetical protein